MAHPPAEPTPMTWLINYVAPARLHVSSSTGGEHVAGSYHYRARALDVVGTAGELRALMRRVKQHPEYFREAFHDPMGWYVKNGRVVRGEIGGHVDHVHLAR